MGEEEHRGGDPGGATSQFTSSEVKAVEVTSWGETGSREEPRDKQGGA